MTITKRYTQNSNHATFLRPDCEKLRRKPSLLRIFLTPECRNSCQFCAQFQNCVQIDKTSKNSRVKKTKFSVETNDKVLVAGFDRKDHAVGDIPSVRFKIVKVDNASKSLKKFICESRQKFQFSLQNSSNIAVGGIRSRLNRLPAADVGDIVLATVKKRKTEPFSVTRET